MSIEKKIEKASKQQGFIMYLHEMNSHINAMNKSYPKFIELTDIFHDNIMSLILKYTKRENKNA